MAGATARRARAVLLAALLALSVALAGCGAGDQSQRGDPALPQTPAAAAQVGLVTVPGLGEVLADGTGYVLYMFPPDAGRRVTCTGPCAGTWPPLAVAPGVQPRAGEGVRGDLLGTLPDPNAGGLVVTYRGHPLYRYAGDVDPKTAHGQAMFLNGAPGTSWMPSASR